MDEEIGDEFGDDDEGRAKRVLATGIALVHEGELVLPAAGSAAQAAVVADDARAVVEFYFPVEIEVRTGADRIDVQAIANHVYERIARRLREGR
jgi:hypothetical protein